MNKEKTNNLTEEKDLAILIDGSSLLYSHFYATAGIKYLKEKDPSGVMQTKDGKYVNAVFSVSRFLKNLIHNQKPKYLLVAWDVKRDTLKRSELYPEYKGNRSKTDNLIVSQINLMKEVLNEWNINQLSVEKYEADDIIGTFSKICQDEKTEVKIISKDNDVMQLIDKGVSVWQPTNQLALHYEKTGTKVTDWNIPANHFEFNIDNFKYYYPDLDHPRQLIDVKTLQGDKSDNIPGIRGVGEKGAISLVSKLGSYENIVKLSKEKSKKEFDEYLKEIGVKARSCYNSLHKYEDDGEISRKLAEIVTDISELTSEYKKENIQLLENWMGRNDMFNKLEFNSLLS